MKKFAVVCVVLTFVVATFAGCGTSAKVTDLGFAYLVQHERTELIGHNNSGLLVFQKPQAQQVVTTPSVVVQQCDARAIYAQLERNRAEIAKCRTFSLNNLRLRLKLGKLFLDLFACKCDQESIPEAIKNFEIAARNYHFGRDIKQHKAEADILIAEVYENWSKAKQINMAAVCSSVAIPQSVAVATQSQPQFVYGWTSGNPGPLESILPSLATAGGMIGAASVLRPSETNITANGGAGGNADADAAAAAAATAAAAAGN